MLFINSRPRVKWFLFFVWVVSPSLGAGIEAQRIAARRAVAVLGGELRPVFEARMADFEERAIEPEVAWEHQVETRGRQGWHHLRLDAGSKNGSTSARLAAAEGFPRKEADARRQFKTLGLTREGGRLPWAVSDLHADLVRAIQERDEDAIIKFGGYLAHFSWDAVQPFSGSIQHDGKQSGNLHLGESRPGDRFFAHYCVEQRVMGELVRRNRNRYLDSVRVLPMDLKPIDDPVEAVFAQMIGATGRLEDLLEADRQITTQLGAIDGESFAKREDEYYLLLDERCGEGVVERLAAAAMLTANLMTGAWERAGRPVLVSGENSGAGRSAEAPPDGARPGEPTQPPVSPAPQPAAGEGFVGSGKSPVYHRPSCEHAQKISASNLVRYATAQEAESQGKRACRVCKPN